jgi:hypothetical protein
MNFGGLLRVGPRVLHIIAPNRVPAELSVLGSRSPSQVRAVTSKLQRVPMQFKCMYKLGNPPKGCFVILLWIRPVLVAYVGLLICDLQSSFFGDVRAVGTDDFGS